MAASRVLVGGVAAQGERAIDEIGGADAQLREMRESEPGRLAEIDAVRKTARGLQVLDQPLVRKGWPDCRQNAFARGFGGDMAAQHDVTLAERGGPGVGPHDRRQQAGKVEPVAVRRSCGCPDHGLVGLGIGSLSGDGDGAVANVDPCRRQLGELPQGKSSRLGQVRPNRCIRVETIGQNRVRNGLLQAVKKRVAGLVRPDRAAKGDPLAVADGRERQDFPGDLPLLVGRTGRRRSLRWRGSVIAYLLGGEPSRQGEQSRQRETPQHYLHRPHVELFHRMRPRWTTNVKGLWLGLDLQGRHANEPGTPRRLVSRRTTRHAPRRAAAREPQPGTPRGGRRPHRPRRSSGNPRAAR